MKLNSTVSDTSLKAGIAHLVGESSRLTPYNPDRAFELPKRMGLKPRPKRTAFYLILSCNRCIIIDKFFSILEVRGSVQKLSR